MEAKDVWGDVTPPAIHVEEQRILHDVHRLIFDTKHTMAELLERLGSAAVSSAQESKSPARRVTISEEVTVFCDYPIDILQLPPALGLLYSVAFTNTRVKAVPNLLRILELLGEKVSPRARGNVLYEEGMLKRKEKNKWQEETKKLLDEQEMKGCTFKPVISDSAKGIAPKGLSTFMEKCVEWKKTVSVRLQKKAVQDRVNRGDDELMTQWKMGERSRKLLQQFKKKGGKREKLWKPKRISGADGFVASSIPPAGREISFGTTEQAGVDALHTPSFHPVTFATADGILTQLRHHGDSDKKVVSDRDESELHNNTQRSSGSERSVGSVRAFMKRLERDKLQRKANLERLRLICANEEKARLYEKGTGQPFFEPNALPTAMKNGTRVPFGDLSKEEQKELTEVLRQNHMEHIFARCLRARRGGSQHRQQDQKMQGRRAKEELVAHLLDQEKRQKRLESLRSMTYTEETFHPKIAARTKRMTSRKSWQPIYERVVPKRRSSEVSKPSFTPMVKTSDACMQQVLSRSADWMEQRERHIQRTRDTMEQALVAECSFSPQRGSKVNASFGSGLVCSRVVDNDALVVNAEARMCTELELLRSQAALRDSRFLSSVRDSLSKVTLVNAPRPSRQSVEQYALNMSSSRSLPDSSSRTYRRRKVSSEMSVNIVADDYTLEDDVFDDDYSDDRDSNQGDGDPNDGEGDWLENMRGIADSWAHLDAQTDSILRSCRYY